MRIRPTLVLVAGGFCLVGCHGGALGIGGGGVTLKRTFKEGEVAQYKMTTEQKAGMTGAMTMTSDMTRTYGKVDPNGSVSVTIVTNNMKAEGGQAAMVSSLLPKETTVKGVIDPQNMIKMTIDPDMLKGSPMASMGSMLSGMTDKPLPDGVQFPTKPVSPGTTWTTPYDALAVLGADGTLTNTFVGPAQVDGKATYEVKYTGTFQLGVKPVDSSNPLSAAMGKIKGSVTITGDAMLDQKDCSLVSTTMSTKMAMTAPMAMEQESVVTQKRVK